MHHKKMIPSSGFFTPRVVVTLLLCLSTCVAGTLFGFRRPDAATKIDQRTLTFAERVAYQRAIEDVYWRHRIWPKERPDSKPSLDAVMSQAQIEKKVADYLRKSQALADYWQRAISSDQLQAEMNRMAAQTRKPEVLRELFNALGNDPFVIAECLARPALADRLLTNSYAYEEKIHSQLKQTAQSELQMHSTVEQMKQLSGKYSELELVKSDSEETVGQAHRLPNKQSAGAAPALQRQDSSRVMKLNSREWDATVQNLAVMFTHHSVAAGLSPAKKFLDLTIGKVSSLQEDETRYYAMAVLSRTNNNLKLATVSWLKEPLETWLAQAENQVLTAMTLTQAGYTLPAIAGVGCSVNTWTATAAPPEARQGHTAVWTGSEMIIWGGQSNNSLLSSGGRYDPATDTWTFTNSAGAPSARAGHTAVWTGTEMIVWGGDSQGFPSRVNTGGKYNPATNDWAPTSTTNAPDGRDEHTAVWTGSEMIVWGGLDEFFEDLNTGGRYNPGTDSWTLTTTTNAPSARDSHTAIWSGSEMIVWGGFDNFNFVDLNTGGRYNPNTDSWTPTSLSNVPDSRYNHTAVWTGSEMIVWGGFDSDFSDELNSGGRYNPTTDSWIATPTGIAPEARELHTAVWTGTEMIIWGGEDFSQPLNTGGRYNPTTNNWTGTSATNAPDARVSHTAVWTGMEMIVWGGRGDFGSGDFNTGGRYNPSSNSWAATNTYNAPEPRSFHTAVWTGSEMIVWGGVAQGGFSSTLNDGARYDPATDSWTATNVADAPSPRQEHTAIWTGSEMIVWGGTGDLANLNSGGRYNPASDTWLAMTSIAPYPRYLHTAVWTGTRMIIWGGNSDVGLLNTGGRYNPMTDVWTETSSTDAPSARDYHTAVWAGNQMIVWGGEDENFNRVNTGGRYDPIANTWTATSTANAPSGREFHTAVWTAAEMIIWGGQDDNFQFPRAGGKYNPGSNTWLATTDIAPDGRINHTAVWTGTQMIVWGGQDENSNDLDTGGGYIPGTDSWTATSTSNTPLARQLHTAVWTGSDTGSQMIVWGGTSNGTALNTGGKYCAQGGPIPTPSPTATPTPRPTPSPRATPSPRVRPTPPPHP